MPILCLISGTRFYGTKISCAGPYIWLNLILLLKLRTISGPQFLNGWVLALTFHCNSVGFREDYRFTLHLSILLKDPLIVKKESI